ncbi:MAG: alpha/beta fold hydrolase [Bacteroidota bacterium]|nr:alpha/beta fold hydrolase [Bacteroidota bacterium]
MSTGLERDIVLPNARGVLAGTLTLPPAVPVRAGVVLLSGSGARTRDYTISGFPMFRLLAYGLAAEGIASIRCDDRGTGSSEGSMHASTLGDFADDALTMRDFLRREIAPEGGTVGFIGHSEGAAVAALAALKALDAPFVVMLAGPCIPAAANILAQTERIARANGFTEERVARERDLVDRVLRVISSSLPTDTLRRDFRRKAALDAAGEWEDARRALSDTDRLGDVVFRQWMKDLDTPWFRSLLAFRPDEVLPLIRGSLLALFGGRDLHVPLEINLPALKQLRPDAWTHVFPEANHFFQEAHIGTPAEVPSLPKRFVEGFLPCIASWVKARTA